MGALHQKYGYMPIAGIRASPTDTFQIWVPVDASARAAADSVQQLDGGMTFFTIANSKCVLNEVAAGCASRPPARNTLMLTQ